MVEMKEYLVSDLERETCERFNSVRERIAAATRRSGRTPDSVRLVAVSKTQPPEKMRAVHRAGAREFGENYVQEAVAKRAALADLSDIRWHLIGHLQRNKVAQALGCFGLIHSLDSVHLASRLARLDETAPVEVLIQVNVDDEATKHGVAPQEVEALLDAVRGIVKVSGLMTIPAPPMAAEGSRRSFARLRELRDDLARSTGLELGELSMGMSDDFEVAIEEGATIVRIGRAIFSERVR